MITRDHRWNISILQLLSVLSFQTADKWSSYLKPSFELSKHMKVCDSSISLMLESARRLWLQKILRKFKGEVPIHTGCWLRSCQHWRRYWWYHGCLPGSQPPRPAMKVEHKFKDGDVINPRGQSGVFDKRNTAHESSPCHLLTVVTASVSCFEANLSLVLPSRVVASKLDPGSDTFQQTQSHHLIVLQSI